MPRDDASPSTLLLTAARRGEAAALGKLLETYRNYLYLLARTQIDLHLRGRANPSDLVQEALFEAYRDFPAFRGANARELMAWLRKILLHNLAALVEKNVLARKRDVRREVSLQHHLRKLERSSGRFEAALMQSAKSSSSPSAQAQRREAGVILADKLAELAKVKPEYRDVIVLRNLEGLSFEDVARRLKRSPGAIRMLWLRALDQLKQSLQQDDLI